MSTQQDIYAASFENRPLMLNKDNYVPWSSRILRFGKSRRNGKLIHNSIINGPYVRRMIPEPCDPNRKVHVNETFHVQTDNELTEKELKQIEADDQAIQTILLSLPEDIYAAVDSCETAQKIWLHVQQMMKADYTQLYNFLKYNQKEVDDLKAERLAKIQDPLALMATSNNPYTFPVLHQDQPSFNQNYMQQPMPNPKDITYLTTAMNMALALMAKAFKLNYSTPTNNNQRISSNPRNRQIAQPARAEGNATGHNADLDEIEEVNANCILMANLQQASTSGTQTDKAPVYDSDGSAEVVVILGFSDLQWGNILITRVYFVEGLGHNLFSVGQFCDSGLEVAFRRNACFIRNIEGVDLLSGKRTTNLYTINLHEMASASPICLMARASSTKTPQQNGVVERRNRTLVEAARTMLIFSRASLFLWAKAILLKPDISFLHVYGALCYPKNDHEDIGKLGAKGDIGFFIGYSADSCAYRVFNRRTKKIIETMNVSFDELSAMAFEQRSLKPRL
nr:integrase, catalytic region, zinc finger, CCHC-type, peptidase aspartic, catalytic [Tanacetum cinerariifolium]